MFQQMQESVQEQTRKMMSGFQFPNRPGGQATPGKADEKK
jgi:hypothetical protein